MCKGPNFHVLHRLKMNMIEGWYCCNDFHFYYSIIFIYRLEAFFYPLLIKFVIVDKKIILINYYHIPYHND